MPKKAVPTITVMPKTKAVAKQILIVNVARDSTHGYSFIYLVYQIQSLRSMTYNAVEGCSHVLF